jgi:hypothetical protein
VPEGPATLGLASDILETLMADEVEAALAAELIDMVRLGASKGGTGGRQSLTGELLAMLSRSKPSMVCSLAWNSTLSFSMVA